MSKFVWGLLMLLTLTPRDSSGDQWQIGASPSFSSGKYGTDTPTDVLHAPVTARRLFTNGDVTVVFPYLCISGPGGVTVVDGTPVVNERTGRQTSRGLAPATPATDTPTTDCGLGDIVVRGRYYLLDEHGWLPTIALRAHFKAPTASAERRLGTGRPDEGVGVEISRSIAGGFLAMVDGGYTVIGKVADADYSNNWWYDLGVGRNLANGVVNLSVFYEDDRGIVQGVGNARDLLTAVTIKGPNGWRLQVSGLFGLSEGSPDHGVSLGLSRRF